jgi:TolB-like protein/Tfp pilus assembly protein PilF
MGNASGAAGTEQQGTSVFLSYSREDRAKAEAIVAALENHRLTVWWDGLIEGGHEFADKIERALTSADTVVVLWSPASVHSHWVRDEAASGRDRGRLVPVTVGGAEPPLGFRPLQHIAHPNGRGRCGATAIELLVRAVLAAGGAPAPERPQSRRAPALVSRRAALIGGVGGVAAVAGGIVGWDMLKGGSSGGTSIGVLPFRNLSGDPAEEYFSDGIADELRATLSQDGELAVAAETSSDLAGKTSSNPRAIASALGVSFVLSGSVRREIDKVRVAAQIVDGSTGFDKWSQTFDRKLDDILAVQSEIADFVTDALLSGIAASKAPRDRPGGTRNSAAFDAYLRGIALYNQAAGQASDFAALDQFKRAVALDPSYAVAQAALSRSNTVIAKAYASQGELKGYYSKAEEAAEAAIRIAPRFADGYSALGFAILNGRLNGRAAAIPYQRSFELGFGSAVILIAYASFAARTGRFADGRAALARAQRLDPLNSTVFRIAGLLNFDARDYDAAASALNTALSLNPKSDAVHATLGDLALVRGDPAAARVQYALEPNGMTRLCGMAIADMKLSNVSAAEAEMAQLTSKYRDNSYYQHAQVFAQWGRTDDALTSLEKAMSAGDAGVIRSRFDPLLDPIRKTVRFAAVERKLGTA